MTGAGPVPGRWSADLCQADSTCRAGGFRASSADGLDLDDVGELLLDVGGVRDHQDLAEAGAEPRAGTDQTITVLAVERAEDLAEHQQLDRPPDELVDLPADRATDRYLRHIGLRA